MQRQLITNKIIPNNNIILVFNGIIFVDCPTVILAKDISEKRNTPPKTLLIKFTRSNSLSFERKYIQIPFGNRKKLKTILFDI